MFFTKENAHLKGVIKWGVFIGLIEGLIALGIILVWHNRDKILPVSQDTVAFAWEFPATVAILALLSLCAMVSTYFAVGHPCWLICCGRHHEGLWSFFSAFLTFSLILALIILAKSILI